MPRPWTARTSRLPNRGTGRDGRGTGPTGPEEKTADAQAEEKPKPGKTGRRGKAGADDEAWLAWIDELTAKGENPTASKAVDAGLAASGSTAKRYLARIRREHSERF